jgi:hypothetical protein
MTDRELDLAAKFTDPLMIGASGSVFSHQYNSFSFRSGLELPHLYTDSRISLQLDWGEDNNLKTNRRNSQIGVQFATAIASANGSF